VRLRFSSRDAAIRYARQHGLAYEVHEPAHIRRNDRAHAQPQTQVMQQDAPVIEYAMPLEIAWAWEAPHLALDRLPVANDTRASTAA
jgi:hypothetical protein